MEGGELPKDINLFSANTETIISDVRQSLEDNNHGWLRKKIDTKILKRPSVSHAMTSLSISFMIGWFIAVVVFIFLN